MYFRPLSFVILLALEVTAGGIRKSALPGHGWKRNWLAPRDSRMKLHIALRQEDGGREAERHLLEISDPTSPSYRQHLWADEAAYLSTPASGSVHAVEFWLWQHGLLHNASLFAGILEIDTTIRVAERLLNTTYFAYSDGTQDVVRTELFYLPDTVAGYIDFVAPTTTFPRRRNSDFLPPTKRGQDKHHRHLLLLYLKANFEQGLPRREEECKRRYSTKKQIAEPMDMSLPLALDRRTISIMTLSRIVQLSLCTARKLHHSVLRILRPT